MTVESWYKNGLRFECKSCGACCKTHKEHAFVFLSTIDVDNISAHFSMKRLDFLNTYCQTDQDGWIYLRGVESDCNFLDKNGHCKVYDVRPKQCETWPFWTENLDEKIWNEDVISCCPGVGSGRLYSAEEIENIAKARDDWYNWYK